MNEVPERRERKSLFGLEINTVPYGFILRTLRRSLVSSVTSIERKGAEESIKYEAAIDCC